MSILSVANVHFQTAGTSRIEYLNSNNDFRILTSNDLYMFPGSGNVIVSGTMTATNFNSSSDVNLKTDIEVVTNPSEKINAIRGVTFTWKDSGQRSMGLIAQEVETVLPELVAEHNGIKTINYDGMTALLVETIKELKTRIEKLENNK